MKTPRLARRRHLPLLLCALLAAALLAAWALRPSPAATPPAEGMAALLGELRQSTEPWKAHRADLSRLLDDLREGRIAAAAISAEGVFVSTGQGERYWLADQNGRVADLLLQRYASGEARFPVSLFDTDGERPWYRPLLPYLAFASLLLVGAAVYLVRHQPFRARAQGTEVTFDDVIGAREAKQALRDVSAYLRDPAAYAALGARPPKGVLLTGEPGTGKTQLAKALASEADAAFIQVTGSDFSSMYFGVGIAKVKALFRQARKQAPCIVFIDEIDGIGKRAEQTRSSDAEGNRIINQFLAELDGFDGSSGVLVLGATNFPNSLDPALVREGRFDRTIAVGLPTLEDREALFRLYAGRLRLADEAPDFTALARNSVGLSPAAIASIVNHAALLAARAGATQVAMQHFVDAIETNRIGEKPAGVSPMSELDRKRIAVHEAGHALVAAALNVGRVEKVTILPRGQALGVTLVTPVEDKRLHMHSELRNRIQMLLAGRGAEQLYFHEVSSGASGDLQEASKIALSMVGALGMGPRGSLLSLQAVREAHLESDPSEALEDADQLLQQLNRDCLALLQRLRPALDRITERLLDVETVPGEDVLAAIAEIPADRAHGVCPLHGGPVAGAGLERVAASSLEDRTEALFGMVAGDEPAAAEPEGPGMA